MQPPAFLIGTLPDGTERWAAIDASAVHAESRTGERRFVAYLTPFLSEADARASLEAEGASSIAIESRKRRGRPLR